MNRLDPVSKKESMKLDQKLVDAAIALIKHRLPEGDWQGAAAMYTDRGTLLTSTAPGVINDGVNLCHETGSILEAYKRNEKVTASVCVARGEDGQYHILSPCGICQERLYFWGDRVEVAVPKDEDSTAWQSKTLREMQPHHWSKIFKKK